MLKTRYLLILLSICVVLSVSWLSYSNRSSATTIDGPNLIVRQDVLGSQWVVRDENISATACSAIEGDVTPGLRTLVRFTVMTPNIGNEDIFVGDPNDHIAANDGLFEFATCHHHYHFRHYALYELVDPRTGQVWRAAKRGFCMLDTDPNPVPVGGVSVSEGLLVCPEGAAAVEGARQLAKQGFIDPHEDVLVINTGSGLKYAESLQGDPPIRLPKGVPLPRVERSLAG